MTTEDKVNAEVSRVRDAFRSGQAPSAIVEPLIRRDWGAIMLVMLGRKAFGLSIGECKLADGWSSNGIDAARFDAYFTPLIESKRAIWDRDE